MDICRASVLDFLVAVVPEALFPLGDLHLVPRLCISVISMAKHVASANGASVEMSVCVCVCVCVCVRVRVGVPPYRIS